MMYKAVIVGEWNKQTCRYSVCKLLKHLLNEDEPRLRKIAVDTLVELLPNAIKPYLIMNCFPFSFPPLLPTNELLDYVFGQVNWEDDDIERIKSVALVKLHRFFLPFYYLNVETMGKLGYYWTNRADLPDVGFFI